MLHVPLVRLSPHITDSVVRHVIRSVIDLSHFHFFLRGIPILFGIVRIVRNGASVLNLLWELLPKVNEVRVIGILLHILLLNIDEWSPHRRVILLLGAHFLWFEARVWIRTALRRVLEILIQSFCFFPIFLWTWALNFKLRAVFLLGHGRLLCHLLLNTD